MAGRGAHAIIDFAREREQRLKERDEPTARIAALADALGETIARAADADHWTTVVSTPRSNRYTFPTGSRGLLQSVKQGGRHGTHEATFPLRSGSRDIGSVRLVTIRPEGFSQSRLDRARFAAECAGGLLAHALDRGDEHRATGAQRPGRDRMVVLPLRLSSSASWDGPEPSPEAS